MIQSAMKNDLSIVGEYQKEIMGSLDQLDDLLAFTEFKETQTEIVREISQIIQIYIREKINFHNRFFLLTDIIKSNIIDWRIIIERKSLAYMNKWKPTYFRISRIYKKLFNDRFV